jgi:hypothetical protein
VYVNLISLSSHDSLIFEIVWQNLNYSIRDIEPRKTKAGLEDKKCPTFLSEKTMFPSSFWITIVSNDTLFPQKYSYTLAQCICK